MGRAVRHPGLFDAGGRQLAGRLLDIAGCETYVVDAPALSPGPQPPVLLLHGYGDTADCWRRVLPALQRHRRVIAIDTPPFGRSGDAPAHFADDPMACYQEFFPAVFDQLKLDRAAIVGHSMGGAMALTIALDEPQLVERLVLIAPAGLGAHAPWWWHAISGRWINWPALLKLPNPVARPAVKTALRGFLEDRLVHDTRAMGEVIDHFVHLHGGPRELRHLIDTGRTLMAGYTGTLLARSAEELQVPVLMLWGAEDRLAPVDHAHAFDRAVSHASVEVLERCGHYPQLELPARVTATLRAFLDERRAPARRRAARPVPLREKQARASAPG
jgi:4,5:9,10-diseco-3-hydroxy-5,9,17-trioxoandrosta-1(10),2-diene-4-oate hydrolase